MSSTRTQENQTLQTPFDSCAEFDDIRLSLDELRTKAKAMLDLKSSSSDELVTLKSNIMQQLLSSIDEEIETFNLQPLENSDVERMHRLHSFTNLLIEKYNSILNQERSFVLSQPRNSNKTFAKVGLFGSAWAATAVTQLLVPGSGLMAAVGSGGALGFSLDYFGLNDPTTKSTSVIKQYHDAICEAFEKTLVNTYSPLAPRGNR